MEKISEIINKRGNTVNNGNKNSSNIDINDNKGAFKSKYRLDRTKFIPNTEETMFAEEIAVSLDDINNYACYLHVVNKIGVYDAERLLKSTLSDIEEKKNTKYPVRNNAKYFMWKLKYRKY